MLISLVSVVGLYYVIIDFDVLVGCSVDYIGCYWGWVSVLVWFGLVEEVVEVLWVCWDVGVYVIV